MNGKHTGGPHKRLRIPLLGAILLAAWFTGSVQAQTDPTPGLLNLTPSQPVHSVAPNTSPVDQPSMDAAGAKSTLSSPQSTAVKAPTDSPLSGIVDPNVVQASCASCGGGLLRGDSGCGPAGCPSIGCNGCNCVPGQEHCCSICDSDTVAGRILCGLYQCICCPDHCYEPVYIPAANASFFVDSARPVTQTRLRYDGLFNMNNADRAEYYFAHFNLGQAVVSGGSFCFKATQGNGAPFVPLHVDISEFSFYQEAARGPFSAFVSMPYRHIDPDESLADLSLSEPIKPGTAPKFEVCPESGFGDITIGTKSLLLDCDLLQFAFQFSTYLPSGNFLKGLGTGHVSLEPAFLFTLKLTPDLYFQGEMAYWIPIAGDALYEAPVWHNRFSLNQVLMRILPDVQLIGTLECINFNVMGGDYTSAGAVAFTGASMTPTPVAVSGAASMFSAGPGIRLDVCKRLDVGVGSQFSFTGSHFAEEEVRVEIRARF